MNEQMFRTIVDTSLDAIGVSTVPALHFVYINDAFERMIGLPRTEVLGRDSINETRT